MSAAFTSFKGKHGIRIRIVYSSVCKLSKKMIFFVNMAGWIFAYLSLDKLNAIGPF